MRTKLHFERVLVLATHADDAELGCGGTMARMVDEDVEVFIAVFSGAEDSLPSHVPRDRLRCEAAEATSALGVPSANLFLYEHAVRKFPEVRQEILEAMVKLRRQVGAPGLKRNNQRLGEDGDTISHAFAVAHRDLLVTKIHVFDPQAQAFEQSQT